MEIQLVLKHCQLAILNFLCVYGVLNFKCETQQTHLHFILLKQYAYWAYFGHNWYQVDTRLVLETRVVIETRLLFETRLVLEVLR